jgi:hypothetical protein
VKGLLVAEEPNFLFSYNITAINARLRRALNRERTNVGCTAYSDRVKDILKDRSPEVAGPLTDLGRFVSGRMHDELGWKDVAIHACRALQTTRQGPPSPSGSRGCPATMPGMTGTGSWSFTTTSPDPCVP